jgi:hypothetical protein
LRIGCTVLKSKYTNLRPVTPFSSKQEARMPRYFLDFRIAGTAIEDEDGAEFADLVAAQKEAILAAREMTANRIRVGKLPLDVTFRIRDQSGTVAAVVPFEAAIEPEGLTSAAPLRSLRPGEIP